MIDSDWYLMINWQTYFGSLPKSLFGGSIVEWLR